MIVQTIELQNFKSYGETQTVDLTGVDATSISGLNGAGKSSIIEALTFALYGRSTATERKELGSEAVIRDGQEEARVAVNFEKDGQTYRVERTATRKGAGKAALTSESGKTLQAGSANVSKMVESIIGMDYETFVSSTIMRQDEMDRITSLRPGERKEVLSKIFGLELYEKLRKTTHERLIKAEAEVEASEEVVRQLSREIAGEKEVAEDLKDARATAERLHAAIEKGQEALQALEKEIKDSLTKKSQYDAANVTLEALQREIEAAKSDLEETIADAKSAKEAEKELCALATEIEDGKKLAEEKSRLLKLREQLTSAIVEKEERMRSIKNSIDEEQEHYDTIRTAKKAECPVCKRRLDHDHKARVLTQYDTRIKRLESEYQRHSKEAAADRIKLEKEVLPFTAQIEKQLEAIQQLKLTKARLEATASRLPKLLETDDELRSKITKATQAKQTAEGKLEKLRTVAEEYEALDSKRTKLSNNLAELREERGNAESTIKHLSLKLEQASKAKTEMERVKRELGAKTEAIPIYDILEDAFGKDGIPTAILRDLVPEVEDEASRILRDLSNGRMSINFRFGRTTERGTQTDELILEAEDDTGLHPVTRFSGGERMRINLALRLGISEAIARRSGYKGKIETLIIDEGLGALDEEGRQATFEILRQLRQRFRKIMVISHVEDVKEAFDTRLVVSKTTAGQSIIGVT